MMSTALTHWCRNCTAHLSLNQIRHFTPAHTSSSGKSEVYLCPTCSSYDVDPLLPVPEDQTDPQVHHCTVIFRVTGPRAATSHFLNDLCTKYPGDHAEIIAMQMGNALESER